LIAGSETGSENQVLDNISKPTPAAAANPRRRPLLPRRSSSSSGKRRKRRRSSLTLTTTSTAGKKKKLSNAIESEVMIPKLNTPKSIQLRSRLGSNGETTTSTSTESSTGSTTYQHGSINPEPIKSVYIRKPKITMETMVTDNQQQQPAAVIQQSSAKKRWLHKALITMGDNYNISSSSINPGQSQSHLEIEANDLKPPSSTSMTHPLKKRRLVSVQEIEEGNSEYTPHALMGEATHTHVEYLTPVPPPPVVCPTQVEFPVTVESPPVDSHAPPIKTADSIEEKAIEQGTINEEEKLTKANDPQGQFTLQSQYTVQSTSPPLLSSQQQQNLLVSSNNKRKLSILEYRKRSSIVGPPSQQIKSVTPGNSNLYTHDYNTIGNSTGGGHMTSTSGDRSDGHLTSASGNRGGHLTSTSGDPGDGDGHLMSTSGDRGGRQLTSTSGGGHMTLSSGGGHMTLSSGGEQLTSSSGGVHMTLSFGGGQLTSSSGGGQITSNFTGPGGGPTTTTSSTIPIPTSISLAIPTTTLKTPTIKTSMTSNPKSLNNWSYSGHRLSIPTPAALKQFPTLNPWNNNPNKSTQPNLTSNPNTPQLLLSRQPITKNNVELNNVNNLVIGGIPISSVLSGRLPTLPPIPNTTYNQPK